MPVTFSAKVLAVVRKIPRGRVLTYGEVARRAGAPRGAQAVGQVLKRNHDPAVPCHRVVRSDGCLGGYNRGPRTKERRLREEGVAVAAGRRLAKAAPIP